LPKTYVRSTLEIPVAADADSSRVSSSDMIVLLYLVKCAS
jgi:hypothetical protein